MTEADNNQLNDGKNDPLYGNPRQPWYGDDAILFKLMADFDVQLSRTSNGLIVSGERDQLDRFKNAVMHHSFLRAARKGRKDLAFYLSHGRTAEIEFKEGKISESRKVGSSALKTPASNTIRQHRISERPPKLADTLICSLLPKKDSIIILGDLVEDFKRLRAERGVLVAKTWYWRQTLSAIRPVLQRILIKGGTLIGAEEFIRRIL